MSRSVSNDSLNDDREFIELDMQRRAGELAYKKQIENFEKESESGTFKVITQVVETIGAFLFLGYILYEIWEALGSSVVGKLVVAGIVLMAISTFVFRWLAKRSYLKGKRKSFKVFNTMSKVSSVSMSVADAITPKGNSIVKKVENTKSAVSGAMSNANKLSKLDDNIDLFVDRSYDNYREKAYVKGCEVLRENNLNKVVSEAIRKFNTMHNVNPEIKRDITMIRFIIHDYTSGVCRSVVSEQFYIQLIGSLCYFNGMEKGFSIPDFIPGIGYTDDMFVLYCVMAPKMNELKAYKIWRREYRFVMNQMGVKSNEELFEKLRDSGKWCFTNVARAESLLTKINSEKEIKDVSLSDLSKCVKMICAYFNGEFDIDVDVVSVFISAIDYYYRKMDAIPDDTDVIGKKDDIVVLNYAISLLSEYVDKFDDEVEEELDTSSAELLTDTSNQETSKLETSMNVLSNLGGS